ncbi:hypothetical protein NOI24_21330 [Neorhizobium galegae]|uniref:hypothetical protein n=1 Tax=Neorhizobium galegae TaxID=399 RepID=UPI00210540FC|nr:hypothetical protein [Neorhizobium galegae]MCQ1773860.1 hypothetical protein [Neorhizobium galegae]MCQ1799673.1 hypothetical protein [Neorhizobium galegae]
MNNKKLQIKSLPPGSGKSRSALQYALQAENVIITTPTDALSLQYEKYFEESHQKCELISRDRNPGRPSHQHFDDALKGQKPKILVNNRVFENSIKAGLAHEVIVDEFREVLTVLEFKNAQYIRELVQSLGHAEISQSTDYYELRPNDVTADIKENGWNYDGVKQVGKVVELCNHVECPHHTVYVGAGNLRKFRNGEIDSITFWSVMWPSVYDGIEPIMIGANAKERLFYRLWQDQVDFTDAPQITGDYENMHHKSHLANIKYVSKKRLSRTRLDNVGPESVFKAVSDTVAEAYPNTPYIFGINKNRLTGKDIPWKREGEMATRVQLLCNGANGYMDRHLAVYLGCQYYSPATYKFMQEVFDIEGDALNREMAYERLYQFVMRISARDFKSDVPFTFIVPDRDCAEYLAEIFKTENVDFLDIGIAQLALEEAAPETEEEKAARKAARKIKNAAAQKRKRETLKAQENTQQYDGFRLIFWDDRYAKSLWMQETSFPSLLQLISEMSQHYNPKSKDKSMVIREGFLVDKNHHTLVSNIQSTKLVFLDIDKTRGDPRALSEFLSQNCLLSNIVYHSHSSTPEIASFRVVIPLDQAVNGSSYRHIVELIAADIDAFFGRGVFVVDGSKRTINCKFHAPCAGKGEVITSLVGDLMQPKMLDVTKYLDRKKPVNDEVQDRGFKVVSVGQPKKRTSDEIEAIIRKHEVHRGTAGGNAAYFKAGEDLLKRGCSFEEVEQILEINRHRFGNEENRDLRGVMKSIRKYNNRARAA